MTTHTAEALRTVKLFVAANAAVPVSDGLIPDYPVNDAMVERFLEIEPPQVRGTVEFDPIIEEIERSYVMGLVFSALSASVITIERMLNTARMGQCSGTILDRTASAVGFANWIKYISVFSRV